SLYQNSKLLGSIYENELAYEARMLGYETETRPNGMFELKGYSPEQLSHFSKRRQAIVAYLDEHYPENATAKEKQWATLNTRASKGKAIPRELLHEYWQVQLKTANLDCQITPKRSPTQLTQEEERELANRAVTQAIAHCAERQSAFRRTQIEQFVFEEIQPFNLKAVEHAIANHPDLIRTFDDRFTTQQAIQRELETIRLMQSGRGQISAIATPDEVIEAIAEKGFTKGQREAVLLASTSRDRAIAWQGVAGSGKTTALREYRHIAEHHGYALRGFAPSAEAAKVLGDAVGIESETVASLLVRAPQPETSQSSEIWIVDEASLLSAKAALEVMKRATEVDARLVLVGDVRQLAAVEAGHPFRSLQQAGMATAHLHESKRQRTPDLKAAVAAVARGDVRAGIEKLSLYDRVAEIPDDSQRRDRLVSDYLSLADADRDRTLVLAGTNVERLAIAQQLRCALKQEGKLGQTVTVTQLRSKGLTDVQSRMSRHFSPGDIAIPLRHYSRRGLSRTQQYRVTAIESERVTLQAEDGTQVQVDPMSYRKSVYVPQALEIAVGDRLRWTRNEKELKRRNGCEFRVVELEKNAAQIEYANGLRERIELDRPLHVDYAWTSTIHGSQGKTADRALVAVDRALGRESFYVGVSRVKKDLKIYTSDLNHLLERAQRPQTQQNPSEVLDQVSHERARPVSKRSVGATSVNADPEQLALELAVEIVPPSPVVYRPRRVVDAVENRADGATDREDPEQSKGAEITPEPSELDSRPLEGLAELRATFERTRPSRRRVRECESTDRAEFDEALEIVSKLLAAAESTFASELAGGEPTAARSIAPENRQSDRSVEVESATGERRDGRAPNESRKSGHALGRESVD
ncbi:MAG: AAA family ATPase, partial [Cyanobacteria bacterium J06648_11]